MTIRIATITVEAQSPRRLADFWSALLDYREVSHPTTSIRIDDPAGTGPTILFQPGRTKTHVMKNRIHLDLRPVSRDDAIERGLRLGAARCDSAQRGATSAKQETSRGPCSPTPKATSSASCNRCMTLNRRQRRRVDPLVVPQRPTGEGAKDPGMLLMPISA